MSIIRIYIYSIAAIPICALQTFGYKTSFEVGEGNDGISCYQGVWSGIHGWYGHGINRIGYGSATE